MPNEPINGIRVVRVTFLRDGSFSGRRASLSLFTNGCQLWIPSDKINQKIAQKRYYIRSILINCYQLHATCCVYIHICYIILHNDFYTWKLYTSLHSLSSDQYFNVFWIPFFDFHAHFLFRCSDRWQTLFPTRGQLRQGRARPATSCHSLTAAKKRIRSNWGYSTQIWALLIM